MQTCFTKIEQEQEKYSQFTQAQADTFSHCWRKKNCPPQPSTCNSWVMNPVITVLPGVQKSTCFRVSSEPATTGPTSVISICFWHLPLMEGSDSWIYGNGDYRFKGIRKIRLYWHAWLHGFCFGSNGVTWLWESAPFLLGSFNYLGWNYSCRINTGDLLQIV